MTKKDFFIIIIKLFGLYVLIDSVLPALIDSISYVNNLDDFYIFQIIFIVLLVATLFYVLIFKAHRVAKFFKLEKGFDNENIDLGSVKNLDIIKFVVLIVGFYLIFSNISDFIYFCVQSFSLKVKPEETNGFLYNSISYPIDYIRWVSCGVNILFGYIFVRYYKNISLYFNKKLS